MSLIQTRPSRLASQQAVEKNQVILNQTDIMEIEVEEIVDAEKTTVKKKNKNEVKTTGKPK